LREPRNYFIILRAIARGKSKLSEIINDTGFEKSLISRYLEILWGPRFVEKDYASKKPYPLKDYGSLPETYYTALRSISQEVVFSTAALSDGWGFDFSLTTLSVCGGL